MRQGFVLRGDQGLLRRAAPRNEQGMPLAYWVHEPMPFLGPHWGNFGIRFYGLGYLLGFLAGAWLFRRYAQAGRSQLPKEQIADLILALVIGVMVGGRLGSFLLYHPHMLLE